MKWYARLPIKFQKCSILITITYLAKKIYFYFRKTNLLFSCFWTSYHSSYHYRLTCNSKESTTEAILSLNTQESQSLTAAVDILLPLLHWECAHLRHPVVVWQQFCCSQEVTAEDYKKRPKHYQPTATYPGQHLQLLMLAEDIQHIERLIPSC